MTANGGPTAISERRGPYREQLESAIKATVLHSQYTFSWFGRRPRRVPTRVLRAMSAPTLRAHMISILSEHLYSYFYCKGYPSPMHWELTPPGSQMPKARLVDALSDENAGTGRWDDGWHLDDGEDQTSRCPSKDSSCPRAGATSTRAFRRGG